MGGSRTLPGLAHPQLSPSEKLFLRMGRAKKEKLQKGSLLPEQHRDINGHTEGFLLLTTAFWAAVQRLGGEERCSGNQGELQVLAPLGIFRPGLWMT